MNIVNSTANKVLELEKRLDNQLNVKSLKVQEFKKTFYYEAVKDNSYHMLTFKAQDEANIAVVQGNVELVVSGTCVVTLRLILDGYIVHSESVYFEAGVATLSAIRALDLPVGLEQELYLQLVVDREVEVALSGYDFFVWGYGDSVNLSQEAIEGRLFASERNGRCCVYYLFNGIAWGGYFDGFPSSLEFKNLIPIGRVKSIAPVYIASGVSTILDYGGDGSMEGGETSTTQELFNLFVVNESGGLDFYSTEISSLDDSTKENIVESGVKSVCVTFNELTNEVVVVFSTENNEVKYFCLTNGVMGEVETLVVYDEEVEEVQLVQNATETSYLIVNFKSGKNYLFPSVSIVPQSEKKSTILLEMFVQYI